MNAKARIVATLSCSSLLAFVTSLFLATGAPAAGVETHPYLESLTAPGSVTQKGPFRPVAVAINQGTGNLYVVDAENDVIDIFRPNGSFLGVIDGSTTPRGLFSFGKSAYGSTNDTPIAIDNSGGPNAGRIYVSDSAASPREVIALAPSGSYLFSLTGKPNAFFLNALGLDVDSHGSLVSSGVVGVGERRISVVSDFESEAPSETMIVDRSLGGVSPADIALDSHDNIYAVTQAGSLLGRIEPPSGLRWKAGNSGGVNSVEVDRSTDEVYALEGLDLSGLEGDPGTSYVSRYDTDGYLQESFGVSIVSQGARDIAVAESSGKVYVADSSKGKIEVFGPRASSNAPDVTADAVTDLASAPTAGTGDLSLLGTGTGDLLDVGNGTISNFLTNTGLFSVGESIFGPSLAPHATIVSVGGGQLEFTGDRNPPLTTTGASFVSGSKTVTNFTPSSGTIEVGDAVYGHGIPSGTFVTAVGGGTITLTWGVTEAAAGASIATVDTRVTLNGMINPQGVPAASRFQYRRQGSRRWTSTALQDAGSGSSDVAASAEIKGLTQNTTYEVRQQGINTETGAVSSSNTISFTTPGLSQANLTIDPASSLTPTSAHLSGTVDPNGTDAKWHFEYATDGTYEENWQKIGSDQTVSAASGSTPVDTDLPDLRPNTTYLARLVGENETGGPKVSEEIEFTTPAAKPDVFAVPAGCLTPTKACLAGYVDAQNSATTYFFEYGLSESYGSSIPVSQHGDVGSGFGPTKVSEQVEGLQPGAIYHFRLVAENAAGTTFGDDILFRTRPDDSQLVAMKEAWPKRGYELVNTPDKGTQAVYPPSRYEPWTSIAPDGDRVLWQTGLGGPQSPTGAFSDYIADYTPNGWVSRSVLPPVSNLPDNGDSFVLAPLSYTSDFSSSVFLSSKGSGYFAHFRTHLIGVDGAQKATTLETFPASVDSGGIQESAKVGRGGKVVLGGGSKKPIGPYPLSLYQPDGSVESVPVPACGYEQIRNGFLEGVPTWVNEDASRIFVYSAGEADCDEPRAIFMLEPETGAKTLVSGAQSTEAEFLRASPSGDALIFGKGDTIYRWSVTDGEECLTCGSGLPVSQVTTSTGPPSSLATPSLDLSHVYFCGPKPAGSPASAECAIYVWRESGIDFVGETSEVRDPGSGPTAFLTSANGSQMIFKTTRPFVASADPTGWNGFEDFGAQAATQLYHYDDDTGILECLSCTSPASGGLPRGDLLASNRPAISADGRTIAFSTKGKVLPQDINSRYDVYEWHSGLIRLVTDGESEFEGSVNGIPRVWGISPDGTNLFFSVGGVAITGNEQDTYGNVYDARLASAGFPPQQPPAHCFEDSCQGPLQAVPGSPGTASSVFFGPGNANDGPKKKKAKKQRHQKRKKAKRHRAEHRAKANHKRGGAR